MPDSVAQEVKQRLNRLVEFVKQLKDMFSTSKDVYGDLLGIDLDDSSIISLVFRNPLGGARVFRADVTGLPAGVIADDTIVDNAQLVGTIKKMLQKAGIQTMNAAIAMPGSKVVIKQIKLDNRLSDEEAEARAWQEARKTFPEIIKNLYLDFTQVEQPGIEKNKKMNLVIVVVRREDIAPRIESLQQAGLTCKIVDVDYYALERVYPLLAPQLPPNHVDKYVALIDFNPHSILFLVMHKKKAIYANRQNYTGDALVPIVQHVMGLEVTPIKSRPLFVSPIRLTPMRAEQENESEASQPTAIPMVLTEDQKSHVVMSVRRLFQSFYAENTGRVIEHIVMTGRCALLADITQHLEKMLDIPTVVGNPMQLLKMGDNVDAQYVLKNGPAFALSCGLAMRGIPIWI